MIMNCHNYKLCTCALAISGYCRSWFLHPYSEMIQDWCSRPPISFFFQGQVIPGWYQGCKFVSFSSNPDSQILVSLCDDIQAKDTLLPQCNAIECPFGGMSCSFLFCMQTQLSKLQQHQVLRFSHEVEKMVIIDQYVVTGEPHIANSNISCIFIILPIWWSSYSIPQGAKVVGGITIIASLLCVHM